MPSTTTSRPLPQPFAELLHAIDFSTPAEFARALRLAWSFIFDDAEDGTPRDRLHLQADIYRLLAELFDSLARGNTDTERTAMVAKWGVEQLQTVAGMMAGDPA